MADPEIQMILTDPVVRQVLTDFKENPQHAQKVPPTLDAQEGVISVTDVHCVRLPICFLIAVGRQLLPWKRFSAHT